VGHAGGWRTEWDLVDQQKGAGCGEVSVLITLSSICLAFPTGVHVVNSLQQPGDFLYINNEEAQEDIKKTIPFKIASKRIELLGVN